MNSVWFDENNRCVKCGMKYNDSTVYACCDRCICESHVGRPCPSPEEAHQQQARNMEWKKETEEYVAWKVKHDEHVQGLWILAAVVTLLISWFMWGYWEHRACIAEYEATGSTHVMATDLCSDHSY